MPRNAISVNRDELEAAIQTVEGNGPLTSLSELYRSVSRIMAGDISPLLVRSRISEWHIKIQTTSGRKVEDNPAENNAPFEQVEPQHRLKIICVPGEPCPFRLTALDENSVVEWAEKVRNYGLDRGVLYLPEALMYFTRQFEDLIDVNHPNYRTVKSYIINWDAENYSRPK